MSELFRFAGFHDIKDPAQSRIIQPFISIATHQAAQSAYADFYKRTSSRWEMVKSKLHPWKPAGVTTVKSRPKRKLTSPLSLWWDNHIRTSTFTTKYNVPPKQWVLSSYSATGADSFSSCFFFFLLYLSLSRDWFSLFCILLFVHNTLHSLVCDAENAKQHSLNAGQQCCQVGASFHPFFNAN